MAEPGRGFDPLPSYPLQQPFASQPGPSFPRAPQPSHTPTGSDLTSDQATRAGYVHNRNVIPGLALGFPHGSSDWQSSRAGPAQHHGAVQPLAGPPPLAFTTLVSDTVMRAGDGGGASARGAREGPTPDDGIEDGEVCEDEEMEDGYDPPPVNATVVMPIESQARERSGSYSPYLSPGELHGLQASDHSPAKSSDHRGGDKAAPKSQFLRGPPPEGKRGSRQMHQPHAQTVAEARKQAQDAILRLWPLNVRYQHYLAEGIDDGLLKSLFKELGFDAGLQDTTKAPPTVTGIHIQPQDISVRQADGLKSKERNSVETTPEKTRALDRSEERKDRIARLLAAKVTKPVSLAMQPDQSQPAEAQPAQSRSIQPEPSQIQPAQAQPAQTQSAETQPAKTQPAKFLPSKPQPAKTQPAKTQPAKTQPAKTQPAKTQPAKTQPAKSRPAQLQATEATQPLATSSSIPAAQSSTEQGNAGPKPASQAMSQSEKSKLLHQKMEALKKAREAREARGQKRPLQNENEAAVPPAVKVTIDIVTPEDQSAIDIVTPEDQRKGAPVSNGEKSDASPISNEHPAPSLIPGLFLSSTPQPSPAQETSGRHSAPLVILDSDERPFKRPFGQAREARPFLIDVSDDEDDAEMEIDSPEHLSSSTHRPISPIARTMSAKSAPSIGDGGLLRRVASPNHTPSGATSSDSSTKEDLETMNKQIEAMKQRIAAAEARKKAKESLPESPASISPNGSSHNGGGERLATMAESLDLLRPRSPVIALGQSHDQIVSDTLLAATSSAQNEPDTDTNRRSLSRAASERLPILEARRRQYQLRLQLLQTQMAGIQKEIQESLQEEERLRQDVSEAPMGEEVEDQSHGAAGISSPTSPEATSPADVVDTSSSFSTSSGDSERSSPSSPNPVQAASLASGDLVAPVEMDSEMASPLTQTLSSAPPTAVDVTGTGAKQTTIESQSDEVEDVVMQEDEGSNAEDSDDEDSDVSSDDYEPPEAAPSTSVSVEPQPTTPLSPLQAVQHADEPVENERADLGTVPSQDQQSTVDQRDVAAPDLPREIDLSVSRNVVCTVLTPARVETREPLTTADKVKQSHTGFAPYETPLQHFGAYRFHREYGQAVPGGLRSLTYSNKVDVNKELCPDELAGRSCPRGKQCQFQHFETMQAPDDQILLQLGACNSNDEKLKQEYNMGLRQLLIEFRNNKVKDFGVISQGIIDYRARFLGDESKVLPLGNVAI